MTDWRALPKVELHCHLLGVIDAPMLARLREQGDPLLVEPGELQRAYPVSDLATFKRWLEMLKPYQAANIGLMRPILAAHISNLIAQGIVYTEIMVSPTMFPRTGAEMVRAVHQWREWTLELERGEIQVEYVMVIPRTLAFEVLELDTQRFLELRRANAIVGVALVGVETGESIQRFARAFNRWRDAGLGIEIHAGEHSGPESVRDALDHGKPNRLGHALSAFQDARLLESIKRSNVHLEFCVTSNLRTAAVYKTSMHPISKARGLGLSFSINTDDPGAFQCSMQSEYELLAGALGFTTADFNTVFKNSLAARFQPQLRHKLAQMRKEAKPVEA
jgi:adenosine deaminase